jgi:hypothetical protein
MHVPMSMPLPETVHTSDAGQPLPPASRQPGTQRDVAESHTRPEEMPPQSESIKQPHEPPATQRAPLRSMRHALWFAGLHSAHVCEGEQTNGAGQSASRRHCTHWSTLSVMSQRLSGAAQSASLEHVAALVQ